MPPVPDRVANIREAVTKLCSDVNFEVIDASLRVTGRDFLLRIWKLIALRPLSMGFVTQKFQNPYKRIRTMSLGLPKQLLNEARLGDRATNSVGYLPLPFDRAAHLAC